MSFKVVRVNGKVVAFGPNDDNYEPSQEYTVEDIKPLLPVDYQSKIDTLEKTSMIPRITREFMLVSFAVQAAGQGIDPMTNIAYSKLKALDDQIATLRSQL